MLREKSIALLKDDLSNKNGKWKIMTNGNEFSITRTFINNKCVEMIAKKNCWFEFVDDKLCNK